MHIEPVLYLTHKNISFTFHCVLMIMLKPWTVITQLGSSLNQFSQVICVIGRGTWKNT